VCETIVKYRMFSRLYATGRMLPVLAGIAGMAAAQPVARVEFEVATVKSSPPPLGDLININLGTVRNKKLTFANASLSDCLKYAFGLVSDDQISGPDWIKSKAVRFDIVGQIPPNSTPEQLPLMLQTLLADRLKLALHHEQKELRYLALVPGTNTRKLREVTPDPAGPAVSKAMPGHITGSQMPMGRLATLLSRFERQIVMDMTGFSGTFEVKLEWTPEDRAPVPAGDGASRVTAEGNGPSLFTAVQEQLGLRLVPRKGPLDIIVIDHAEQIPVDN
jgi:uncharacterized protein (TIGR03435 family)